MDESALSLQFPLRCRWMKRGQQTRLPAASRPQDTLHLFGVYNWRSRHVTLQPAPAKNSLTCLAFLHHLLTVVYPSQTLILVLDNAPFHHSNLVQAFLSLFEHRLLVCWLPPYSPDLNPIERFWKHLKDRALANKLFLDPAHLAAHALRFADAHNSLSPSAHLSFSHFFQ